MTKCYLSREQRYTTQVSPEPTGYIYKEIYCKQLVPINGAEVSQDL